MTGGELIDEFPAPAVTETGENLAWRMARSSELGQAAGLQSVKSRITIRRSIGSGSDGWGPSRTSKSSTSSPVVRPEVDDIRPAGHFELGAVGRAVGFADQGSEYHGLEDVLPSALEVADVTYVLDRLAIGQSPHRIRTVAVLRESLDIQRVPAEEVETRSDAHRQRFVPPGPVGEQTVK